MNTRLIFTLSMCLCALSVFASDTIAIDSIVVFQPDNIIDVVGGVKDLINGDVPLNFDMFYVYVTGIGTFLLGFLRNLLPKWEWIQNLNLTAIPREVTVALLGVSVVAFIVASGVSNVDWPVLVGSVFGTMGFYAFVKSLVDKVPNPMLKTFLLMLLGRFSNSPKA